MLVKPGKGVKKNIKAWATLFVCLQTRFVHIIAHFGMSAADFRDLLLIHIWRFAAPSYILVDNLEAQVSVLTPVTDLESRPGTSLAEEDLKVIYKLSLIHI